MSGAGGTPFTGCCTSIHIAIYSGISSGFLCRHGCLIIIRGKPARKRACLLAVSTNKGIIPREFSCNPLHLFLANRDRRVTAEARYSGSLSYTLRGFTADRFGFFKPQ